VQGHWRLYCRVCQHLTLPRAEAERALREMPAGAVGVVVAVSFPVVLTPVPANA
jgi:hypothetical protein